MLVQQPQAPAQGTPGGAGIGVPAGERPLISVDHHPAGVGRERAVRACRRTHSHGHSRRQEVIVGWHEGSVRY
ncbi:hypothetical protein Raf01_57500 [Rugosimonospora africana]|uniref:Uncharacterized protein n=1 Tax=Rugosimonospora africana TaxID=556532 RepID=A0A8J3VTJ6_9ACTN|nr:hypothetical protein Raf01_57500 [Rugosimonospora africana]